VQEYLAIIGKESALIACEKNTKGSRPKELFEDALEDAQAQYEKDKSAIKDAVHDADFTVDLATTFDDFCKAIAGESLDSDVVQKINAITQVNK
jgi:pre-mRNA-processing factor 40